MINFREIFNINYSYIGLVLIAVLMIVLVMLDKSLSIKVFGYSFFCAGFFMLVIYLIGNMIVSSFSYRFFIEVISDNFFNSIIIFSVVTMLFGGISLVSYRYINRV